MKKIIISTISVCFFISFFACNKKETDVVNGTEAVSSEAWRDSLVKAIQTAPNDSIRNQIMGKEGPRLMTKLVPFLRQSGYDCTIDTILYFYGSGSADSVASGDGKKYNGVFKNQPYALIKGGKCFNDSMYVFILCFNQTFEVYDPNRKNMTTGLTTFTIEKGKGLNTYVDYETSIFLAKHFDLPLYKGKSQSEKKKISPETALTFKNELDRTAVTVAVEPGWRFNLGSMTLTK